MDVKRLSLLDVFICTVSAALLAFYFTVWLFFAGNPAAKRSDFMIYYAAGTLPLSKLYNIDAQREVQTSVMGSPFPIEGGVLPFNHTPVLVPLLHLVVDDDYAASYLRWTALLWLAAFVSAVVVIKMTGDVALAFATISFYPLFTYIQQGHDTVFMLLGVLLCAYMLSLQNDFLAGIALSLTALKPHFAIFIAIPLIAKPKAFLGFCIAAVSLAFYSVLLVGTKGVAEFLAILRISAGGEGFGMRPLLMLNLLGLMERAGVSSDVARPVGWAVFVVTAILLLLVWKRNPSKPPLAVTLLLAVFTSPHLHGHDLALLVITFITLSKPNAVLLIVSSLALLSLSISSTNWLFVFAYFLMLVLLILSIRDIRPKGMLLDDV